MSEVALHSRMRARGRDDRPFARLGRLAEHVLQAAMVVVVVLEDQRVYLSTAEGLVPGVVAAAELPAGEALLQSLARSGDVALVTDTASDPRTRASLWLRSHRVKALAVSPIEDPHGRLLGALCVADTVPRVWTADDIDLLAALADLAASKIALRSSVRRSEETAALLQHSMLTELPQVDHVELLARYLPAQDSAQIGGDWYDAFVLPDGVTGVVVGDVAGHDMPAAAQMGQLRNLLRGIAWHTNPLPHEALSALDTTAHGLDVTDLATAIYGRIEVSAAGLCRFRWANAGHPPPLLVTHDGTSRYLVEPSGILLAFGDSRYSDGLVALPAGSTLLLYTDGLVESRQREIDDGLARLAVAAETAAAWSLQAFGGHVLTELVGSANEDDVTVLAIRVPG